MAEGVHPQILRYGIYILHTYTYIHMYIASKELTFPLLFCTFESMIFLFPFGGICEIMLVSRRVYISLNI